MNVTLMGTTYEGCRIEHAAYADGSPALIVMQGPEQVAVATVRLVHEAPAEGCVWIKDYAENEGMLASLVAAGVVEATGRWAQAGFVTVPEARPL
jgi:glutamate 5-kinase